MRPCCCPLKRSLEELEQGKQYLSWGPVKNPEREKYLYFSIPCMIYPPTMVVIRKSDLRRFGGGDTVSLKALLEDRALRFLMFSSLSFGDDLDELIKGYEKA